MFSDEVPYVDIDTLYVGGVTPGTGRVDVIRTGPGLSLLLIRLARQLLRRSSGDDISDRFSSLWSVVVDASGCGDVDPGCAALAPAFLLLTIQTPVNHALNKERDHGPPG